MANYLAEMESELRDAPRRASAVAELLASWNTPKGMDHDNVCAIQTLVDDLHDGLKRLLLVYEESLQQYQRDRAKGIAS